MKKVLDVLSITSQSAGVITGALLLQVSTAADLPDVGETIDNYIVDKGSIAMLIQDGGYATLDDDEKWYKSDGSGEA